MIKKIIALVLIAAAAAGLLTACTEPVSTSTDGVLRIVCTTFPQYDWVRQLTQGAENVNVELLLNSGRDLHSYQPGAQDIVKIATADVIIYTGGSSEKWINDVLETSENEHAVLIDLMHSLPEGSLYCVEAAGEENHSHEEHSHAGEEHNHTEDEHVWLSVKNAIRLTGIIKAVLCDLDGENSAIYAKNHIEYHKALTELDGKFENMISSADKGTLVFADRFPFIYLVKDYGLSYYAAFSGCSAESEASFETVTRLAGKIDGLGLSYVLITETSDGSVARTVRDCTKSRNQEILTLDAMQSVKKDKLSLSYIEIMESNLEIIKTALS